MKKAIIYTRAKANLTEFSLVSTTVQTLSRKKYAEENDIQIVGLYSDIRLLGTNADYPTWKDRFLDFLIKAERRIANARK